VALHYFYTILRLRIGARLTRYRNCKFHNFARTRPISRHADGISRYSVPPSAGALLPLRSLFFDVRHCRLMSVFADDVCPCACRMFKRQWTSYVKHFQMKIIVLKLAHVRHCSCRPYTCFCYCNIEYNLML